MEVLQFILSGPWICFGTVVLILALGDLMVDLGKAIGYAVHGVPKE